MFSSPSTFGRASKTWNSRILFRFRGRRLTDRNITFLIWVSAVLASVHDVLVRRLESVATLTLVDVIWWGTCSGWKDSSISLFRRLFWWCIFDEFAMLLFGSSFYDTVFARSKSHFWCSPLLRSKPCLSAHYTLEFLCLNHSTYTGVSVSVCALHFALSRLNWDVYMLKRRIILWDCARHFTKKCFVRGLAQQCSSWSSQILLLCCPHSLSLLRLTTTSSCSSVPSGNIFSQIRLPHLDDSLQV